MFCRFTRLLSFCENRLCLSQLIKKLNSTEWGALFWHFCVSKVITTTHAHQSGVIFHFFKSFQTKKLFPTFLYHVKEESQTNLLMKTAWKNSNGKLTKLSFEFEVFSIFESRYRCARWAAAQRAVIRIDQGKSRWVAIGMLKCTVIRRTYLQLDCTRLLSSGAFHPKSAITAWLYLWAQVEGFVRRARSLGGPICGGRTADQACSVVDRARIQSLCTCKTRLANFRESSEVVFFFRTSAEPSLG